MSEGKEKKKYLTKAHKMWCICDKKYVVLDSWRNEERVGKLLEQMN